MAQKDDEAKFYAGMLQACEPGSDAAKVFSARLKESMFPFTATQEELVDIAARKLARMAERGGAYRIRPIEEIE